MDAYAESPGKIVLSVALIVYNEERKLPDCLRSVPFADEIVIVDSGSNDGTRAVAEAFGAKFYTRPFTDFAEQKNAAIEKTSGDWVLLVDADERLTPKLQAEVRAVLSDPAALDAYWVKRQNHLFGGPMRFGANAGDWQLRLLRRGRGCFHGPVHERIETDGKAGHLRGELVHHSYQTLAEYNAKFPLFCSLDAEAMWQSGKRPHLHHFLVKVPASFCYFYVWRFGFLDGFRGFLYQALAARYLWEKYRRTLALFKDRGPVSALKQKGV